MARTNRNFGLPDFKLPDFKLPDFKYSGIKYSGGLGAMLICASLFVPAMAAAQNMPMIVLEYPGMKPGMGNQAGLSGSDNAFVRDPDYSTHHKVAPNETLSHVMQQHYGGSGLNMQFVQMAIVAANKTAFVRNNPNFLYAGKTLHLPSVNEIQTMILGRNAAAGEAASPANGRTDAIYFIGG